MLDVAVIGTGGIARAHLRGYLEFPDQCRVTALVDVEPTRAVVLAEEFGLDGAQVLSSHAALAGGGVDLVSVCTPPSTHAPIAIDLLRAGMNVLVEKPMAPSVAECDAIIAAARESGRLLSVVAQNRFRDDLSTLKEAIDSGLLGPVTHLAVDSSWWRGLPYYDLAWRGTWESEGGGPTLNHAIHHIDLMLWLLGSAPQAVAAMMTNAAHENSEVEDLSVAVLRYERALARLTSSVVHHGEQQSIVVQGRDAAVGQPWAVHAEHSGSNGFPAPDGDAGLVERLDELAAAHVPLEHTGHTGQIADVLDAVATGRRPVVTGDDGRLTVEVVTAIYQAAIEERTVALPLPLDDAYYTGEGLVENAPRFFPKARSVAALDGAITVPGTDPAPQANPVTPKESVK